MRYVYILLLVALSHPGWAQTSYTPVSAGNACVKGVTADSLSVSFSIGQVIYSRYDTVRLNTPIMAHAGFPYDAIYLSNTFVGELSCSKGYYSDYVSLAWTIGNNSSKITDFIIYRRILGSGDDFEQVATLTSGTRSWQDIYCEASQLYEYKVYAEGVFSQDINLMNYITAYGFRNPMGTVTGRVTYSGGTSVVGVSVVAETDEGFTSYAADLNGTSSYLQCDEEKSLTAGTAFTFQAWVKNNSTGSTRSYVLDKDGICSVWIDTDSTFFSFGDGRLSAPSAYFASRYFHISATRGHDTLVLMLQDGDTTIARTVIATGSTTTVNADTASTMFLGQKYGGTYRFNGQLDEVRIWNITLDSATITQDYTRLISGKESGLKAYYRFNEGVGEYAYDQSHKGYTYNENHMAMSNVTWSTTVPGTDQLALKGVTDSDGNYIISGIPYASDGSTYTFTPMMGVHTFTPTQALRYLAAGADAHNNVDFTDNSSFSVSGVVYYQGGLVPVEGATVLIDGSSAVKNSAVVTSDADGTFTIDVPIGMHRITLSMTGHTFVDGFPAKGYKDTEYEFLDDIATPITFYDATLATLAGRIAGGTEQDALPLGFGLSDGNLGYGEISLELVNQKPLRDDPDTATIDSSGNDKVNSSYHISTYTVTIHPDTATGEYVVLLPPGTYAVTTAIAGDLDNNDTYTFDNSYLGTFDLDVTDEDSSQYVTSTTVKLTDSTSTTVNDTATCYFNKRYDFIYRVTPTISLTQKGQDCFGDTMVVFTDTDGNITDTVMLYDAATNDYTLGNPVYHTNASYTFDISVYEEYTNLVTKEVDRVPQTDSGVLSITNNLAATTSETDSLNEDGTYSYVFTGGSPNLISPHTHDMNMVYTYTIDEVDKTVKWTGITGSGLTGIIIGGQSTGSNFVTSGPTYVDMILRDPTGSNSYAYLEKGVSITSTTSYTDAVIADQEIGVTFSLGADITSTTSAGVGVEAGVEIELDITADATVGASFAETRTWNNTFSTTISSTEKWSTSESSDYVGSMGDVFIGHASNCIFGKTNNVCIKQDSVKGVYLGTTTGYSISTEYATAFKYTQNHIENYLIPNLVSIRNNFFIQQPDVYIQHVEGDYDNDTTWGNGDTIYGDAYDYVPLTQMEKYGRDTVCDSIALYNQWISGWESILEQNEETKVASITAAEGTNHSFDAGTTYEGSTTTNESESASESTHFEFKINIAVAAGATIQGVGTVANISINTGYSYDYSFVSTEDSSITYGYVLADENSGDYMSVDAYEATDGFSTVFRTRGGQTTCPYEDEEVTKYYEPGAHVLNTATEQLEVPVLAVDDAYQIDVPSTSKAYFTLTLSNGSTADFDTWFDLAVIESSNPDGAVIQVDGASLGDGRAYTIPALESITKTLTVAMGSPDVFSYKNIGIVLRSQCQADPTDNWDDIADTVWINVEFTPACTDVTLSAPLDQWVMNTNTGSELSLKAVDYNKNDDNFQSISFQYKPSSSSTWLPLVYLFADTASTAYDNCQSTKKLLSGSTASYTWDANDFSDQKYDIRAVANCSDATAYSDIAAGIKDMQTPVVYGTPQPSDGILSHGEDISVQFNEDIAEGLVQDGYIEVSGVLNGSAIAHATSLAFDGSTGYAKSDGFSFSEQPVTVEFWMKRGDATNTGTIFSKGTSDDERFEISCVDNSLMQVTLGDKSYTFDPSGCFSSSAPSTSWHHYAVAYDTAGTLAVYGDDQILLEQADVDYSPSERGAMFLGRSASGDNFVEANVDEVRVWSDARTFSEVYANMSVLLSGSQENLVAYWPLSDGKGTQVTDRANAHTLTVNASWEISLENAAMQFDASEKQAMLFDARSMVIDDEQDATIEFWIKAPAQSERACLLYNGLNDSTASGYNASALGLFLETSGYLTLTSNGVTSNLVATNVCDNTWHHVALVIDRQNNLRSYLDGELQQQLSISLMDAEIAGLDMSIGARREQITTDSAITTNYYTGIIDEIRIWETARKATLINRYMNTKLRGTEAGLLYYYPFEAYFDNAGVQSLMDTLANIVDTVSATLVNAPSFTTEAPSVKDALPVQTLDVSYAVNDDELLITLPTEYAYLYENCTLDISVRNIYDENGNKLASPAQWIAYIDQNPVVWSSSSESLSFNVGDGASFSVDVVNKGGEEKDFSITGLPAWLTAEPEAGTVEPNSSVSVTFTVNADLNIGSYDKAINLTTDYGYDEKLQVTVTVSAEAPAWTVIPGNYQYTMNVFAKLNINGTISTDENDMVAAFIGGECRGVSSLEYLSSFDVTEAMLSIYSNSQSGDSVTFLIWDASEGTTYSNVTPVYTFVADTVHGTPASPVTLSCDNSIRSEYDLSAGWNWISVNVINAQSNSVENLLGSVGSEGDEIKGQQSVFDKYSTQAGWSGTLTASGGIEPENMYKMKLTTAGTAIIDGVAVDVEEVTVSIARGWNWIGYVPQYNISVDEALSAYGPSEGDLVKSQRAFSMYYDADGWIGTLNTLVPGQGYMLKSANTSTLIYPEKGSLKSFDATSQAKAPAVLSFTGGAAQSNATVIAQVAEAAIDLTGKVLASYSGSTCTGYATPTITNAGDTVFFLVVDEIDGEASVAFALVDTVTGSQLAFDNLLTYVTNNQSGSVKSPYLLYTKSTTGIADEHTAGTGISVYPNPFSSSLVVSGSVIGDSKVTITLINALGQELLRYQASVTSSFSVDLFAHDATIGTLPGGWYIVEVISNEGVTRQNVLKQ